MAEVIGIIAAAIQLAGACMRLLETIRKIKGSSKTLKRYQNQLQDLRDLSATITQNPILQTPEVKAHTQSLLALISEHNFETLLRKPRLLRNLQFLNTQRDLLDIFDTIEKGKTSLSLVILSIEAKALDQIRVDVKSMANPTRSCPESYDTEGPLMKESSICGDQSTLLPPAKSEQAVCLDTEPSGATPGKPSSQEPHMGNSAFAGERNSDFVALAIINEVLKMVA
ncbi:hypothetical protein EV126DRAFT_253513 [Verticillium dahliae]|nr:hypothetical protein EV126DRAFT_253513 [Verticillium dahliae]